MVFLERITLQIHHFFLGSKMGHSGSRAHLIRTPVPIT